MTHKRDGKISSLLEVVWQHNWLFVGSGLVAKLAAYGYSGSANPLNPMKLFIAQDRSPNQDGGLPHFDPSSLRRSAPSCCRLSLPMQNFGECKELLLEFANLYPKIILILDALDECDKLKRCMLVEIFNYLVDYASRPVKIFISSRPDGDIKERFKSRSNIEIQATDISRFVESESTY